MIELQSMSVHPALSGAGASLLPAKDFGGSTGSKIRNQSQESHNLHRDSDSVHETRNQTIAHPSPLQNVVSNWWLFELLAALMCTATFIAMAAILYQYDGGTIPRLPFGVPLNAVIATIATMTKASLLLVATSALSQFKWLWVQDKRRSGTRRLQDLQMFDEASRGPLGALKMLCSTPQSIASIGAMIVLVSLAFDPFIQGLISYPSRSLRKPTSAAMVLRAEEYFDGKSSYLKRPFGLRGILYDSALTCGITASYQFNDPDFPLFEAENTPNPTLQAALLGGVYYAVSFQEFSPTCPAASCEWPIITSLGLCSACEDVTDLVSTSCEPSYSSNGTYVAQNCTYDLPNTSFRHLLANDTLSSASRTVDELTYVTWSFSQNNSASLRNTIYSLGQMTFMSSEIPHKAYECAFAMCIQEYNVAVTNGALTSGVLSAQQPFAPEGYAYNAENGYLQNTVNIGNTSYTVDDTTVQMLAQALSVLEGAIPGDSLDYVGSSTPSSSFVTALSASNDFPSTIKNIASAGTQYIRNFNGLEQQARRLSSRRTSTCDGCGLRFPCSWLLRAYCFQASP